MPRPKVDSVVLNLAVRDEPPVNVIDPQRFFHVVKTSFGQRRKTLLNSLTGIYGRDRMQVANILDLAGIDPMRRAETLSLIEFAAIANLVGEEDSRLGEKE